MPLYPYRCTKCGYRFEKIQSFSSKQETECPECKGLLERLLTVPGLNFKGGGWYINDYASGKGSTASDPHDTGPSSATKIETSAAPATSDAKSESKPAASSAPASTTAS